jgi:exopolysaccharide biosynthesis polyprenyl glycosylphosphotransferase
MNTLIGKRKSNGRQAVSLPASRTDFMNEESGLYLEDYFHITLKTERKRAERSKKPFILMLLHIENAFAVKEKKEAVSRMANLLFSLTRETDIKGWYEPGSILGVIFTETNGMDKELIREKIRTGLIELLDREQAGRIRISLHTFPEEQDDDHPDGSADMTLYTDLSRKNRTRSNLLVLKRVLDIAGSLLGILLFLPFFLVIPLVIKFTSRGPVFFRQERVGQYGKRFTFLKFRSMHVNCDSGVHREYVRKLIQEKSSYSNGNGDSGSGDPNPVYKICDDSRITPFGRFLRKTSLDELPQFFNVLIGEMSLVGPRPPIPYEIENYDIWHRRRIHEVKPGITGLWQVRGRSSTNFDEMVRLDLKYSREWSLWLDLKIIFQTPVVLLIGKGAY